MFRYSRGVLKEQYLTTITVLLSECIKLVLCMIMIIYQQKSITSFIPHITYIMKNSLKVMCQIYAHTLRTQQRSTYEEIILVH